MISVSLLAVMGYGLFLALATGIGSQRRVSSFADSNRALRDAHARLREDLLLSADDQLTITVLGDGNDQLDLMHPVEVGGVLEWGVFDESLGTTPAEQNRPDWLIRYTVDVVVMGGVADRRLVRRIIDDLGAVRTEEILLTGLRTGTDDPPGFKIDPAGDLWQVTVSTEGTRETGQGRGTSFHVRTRN